MRVESLGYRTDLALLSAGGTRVEDRGDHLVVRSLHNQTHWWGNFLLLERPPSAPDAARWLERFVEAILGRGEILVHPEESLRVQQIIDALYASAATGKEATIPV